MEGILPIVILCGVGVDLFTLPLLLCALMLCLGMFEVHPAVTWMATWWTVGGAALSVLAEWTLDEALCRNDAITLLWRKLQLILSMCVTLAVVAALSKDLSGTQVVGAVGMAFVQIGAIRGGRSALDPLVQRLPFLGRS
jgi:hypothetical protein